MIFISSVVLLFCSQVNMQFIDDDDDDDDDVIMYLQVMGGIKK
jgi:hypothetical protein